ncbi:MAG: hypothetical protein ACO3RV_04535 [Luteolibacter sp.]
MTTYDSAGYPVQSVDPVAATVGVAAAGLIGYALADSNNHCHVSSPKRYHHVPRQTYYCPPPLPRRSHYHCY